MKSVILLLLRASTGIYLALWGVKYCLGFWLCSVCFEKSLTQPMRFGIWLVCYLFTI